MLIQSAEGYIRQPQIDTAILACALLAGLAGGQTLVGGSAITDILKLQGTSGNGTLTSPAIQLLVGNNGAMIAATVLNNGNVGIGTTSPTAQLSQKSTAALESGVLGAELLASGGWTATGWTGTNPFAHTTGNVTALSNTFAAVVNTYYQITYTITGRTAGSVVIALGGQSTAAITATGAFGPRATTTGNFTVTPTTDFDGTITLSVKSITAYGATYDILDNVGNANFEIRSSLASLNNTFIGKNAGGLNTTGNYNSAQGAYALNQNTTGYYNSAQGAYALNQNTTGYSNSAQGAYALQNNTTGYNNSAQGANALNQNTTGYYNSAQGANALYDLRPTSLAISAFADYSGTVAGTVRATSVAHGRTTNDSLIISGTVSYNGTYTVTVIDDDNFYFTKAWVATEKGWWTLAGQLGSNNTAVGYNTGRGITYGSGNTILGAGVTGLAAGLTNNIILANGTGAIKAQNDGTNWNFTGNVSVGTVLSTNILNLGGNAARIIWMERHTTANNLGNSLSIQAGGATAGATNKAGGQLILMPGVVTGAGEAGVTIQGSVVNATATADGTFQDMIKVLGVKLGVFNTTPVVQQNTIIDAAVAAGETPTKAEYDDLVGKFNALLLAQETYGWLKAA